MVKECYDAALKELTNISRDELEQYVREVMNKAKTFDPLQGVASIERAKVEVDKEKLASFFEDANQKARNVAKFQDIAKDYERKNFTTRDVLAKRFNKPGDNVPTYQHAASNRLQLSIFKDFDHDTMDYFSNGANDAKIAQELDGVKTGDAKAKFVAERIKKYVEYRNEQLIVSGALRFDEVNGDRMLRQVHDQGKIISGSKSLIQSAKDMLRKYNTEDAKKLWVKFIKDHLDLDKTFRYTDAVDDKGKLDDAKVDQILSRTFDNISTGKSDILTQSTVVRDSQALAKRSRMFFVYKDWRSFLDYNKTYGKNNLFGALVSDIHGSGNKIGLSEKMGNSPFVMYNELAKRQQEVNPKNGFWWANTENYFKTLLGQDKQTRSPTVATFASNLRMLTSMARLPLIAVQSISDVGYMASFAQRWGVNYFSAWTHLVKNMFNKIKTDDRAYIAKIFKLNADSHLGYMGRWVDANNTGEIFSKISTGFFKGIGLSAFDEGNKISAMELMAKNLHDKSNLKFSELNDDTRKQLGKFLSPEEWELLRKNNSQKMFTTDNVDNLTNEQLKQFHTDTNSSVPLYELKNDLYRKVYSMFDVASENAVLSPGVFERAWCYRGTAPGTADGEVLRILSQFKMYTMSYIDRVLVQGWKNADTASQKLTWGISMLMGTLPLSILSSQLGYIANNVNWPDPNQMTIPQKEQFLLNLTAPSLSIFSGIVDPNNQNSSMVWSMLGSPTTRLISDSLASGLSLVSGDPKKSAKLVEQAAGYMIPLQNTPIVTPFLQQALGTQSHLEPGQTRIFGH